MQLENQIKELKAANDESDYQLEKSKDRVFKLERHLSDTLAKLNSQQTSSISTSHSNCNGNVTTSHSTSASSKLANLTDEQVFM